MDAKPCLTCDGTVLRLRSRDGRLGESHSFFARRIHCDMCRGMDDRNCAQCSTPLVRRRGTDGRYTEQAWAFRQRRFCSPACGNAGRSAVGTMLARKRKAMEEIARIRRAAEERCHAAVPPPEERRDQCFKCGGREALLLHHRDGDWTNNRPENLTPICIRCRIPAGGPHGTTLVPHG